MTHIIQYPLLLLNYKYISDVFCSEFLCLWLKIIFIRCQNPQYLQVSSRGNELSIPSNIRRDRMKNFMTENMADYIRNIDNTYTTFAAKDNVISLYISHSHLKFFRSNCSKKLQEKCQNNVQKLHNDQHPRCNYCGESAPNLKKSTSHTFSQMLLSSMTDCCTTTLALASMSSVNWKQTKPTNFQRTFKIFSPSKLRNHHHHFSPKLLQMKNNKNARSTEASRYIYT